MQEDLQKVRIQKLKDLLQIGIDPYPAKANRTHSCSQALNDFDQLKDKTITLCGRVFLFRPHGKATFMQLGDSSAKIQLYFKQDDLGQEKYKLLKKIDLGDFLQISGKLFKTKTGEKTLKAKDFKLLTKSLCSLPEKFHGLKNKEERYRKRYLDLITNPEVFSLFKKRTEFINAIRDYMQKAGFMEVETPILEHIPGGADATPFITHHNALDIDLYLRISLELHLKRLIIGGYEKIFEIGKVFRNEGISTQHLQEFTLLEFYWAYADWQDLIKFIENFYTKIIKDTFGRLRIKYKNNTLDFTLPWKQYDYCKLIKEETKIDLDKIKTEDELRAEIKKRKIDIEEVIGFGRLIDQLYKKAVRPRLVQPCFLINHPLAISPLAKKDEKNPNKVQRLQVLIAGEELGNGYSELNDPIDQKQRFEEQVRLRQAGDEEAQMMDQDFIEALEYGMPPTAGFGVGIDRFFALLSNAENIRDIIFFPLMRQEHQTPDLVEKISKNKGPITQVKNLNPQFTRQRAWELLKSNLKTKNLIKHSLASEAIMSALAEKLNKPKLAWAITGLVHDLDFDYTKDTPDQHGVKTAKILREFDAPEDIINAVQAHNFEHTGISRSTDLDFGLCASEQLSGLIVATALVQPDKKLSSVKVDSVLRKFKERSFSANVNRQNIQDIEKLGINLEDFIKLAIKAMQGINKELGL